MYLGYEIVVVSVCDLKVVYDFQFFNGFFVSEICFSIDIIFQEDFFGVLYGLGSFYSLEEIVLQGQFLLWVVDEFFLFFVGQYD